MVHDGSIVQLTKKQEWSIARSNARINIWEGAVRSGKTTGLNVRWPMYVQSEAPHGELFFIGRSLASLERNVLKQTSDLLGPAFDYSLGKGKAWIAGREISLISAYDEASYKKIRGATVAGWCGDELTLWPENFWRELLQRMSPPGSKGFGTTNADSPFHYLKKDLDRWRELGWQRFRFLLDDNTFLTQEFIDALKRENVGLWYQRFILSMWVLAAGAVFDMFDEDKVLGHAPGYFPKYGVSVDYGTANPTAFGLFGFGRAEREVWLLKTYYYDGRKSGRSKTDAQYADDFEAFVKGIDLDHVLVDPSALSFITELRKRKIKVRPAINDVQTGLKHMASMIDSGRFRIDHDKSNRVAVEEFGAYLWDEKAQARGIDEPLKMNDHCMDLIRYELRTMHYTEPSANRYRPMI